MPIIALSVTEVELFAATQCAMDMLFTMRILNGLGLKVKLPMILEVDNKAAVDLCNNWSIGGRTRHVEVKQYFLRELKERGLINVRWTSGESMTSDIFTKNLAGPLFDKHAQSVVGRDSYMETAGDVKVVNEVEHVIPKGRVSEYLGHTGDDPRMWSQESRNAKSRCAKSRNAMSRCAKSNSAEAKGQNSPPRP